MPIEKRKFITRRMLQAEPDTIFVFGDNMLGLGFGGQAKEMRGEPNAFGIPTKHKPSNKPDAFFTDEDFNGPAGTRIMMCLGDLLRFQKQGRKIVLPEDGIGTGLADLERRAPKIWAIIQRYMAELEKRENAKNGEK